jgi:hypothetical protein
MPFTEMYSNTICESNSYSKKVKVLLSTGNDGKDNSYWVDKRIYYIDGEKIKPLKFDVCLTLNELEKLLPDMMDLKDCEVKNDRRRVWFEKRESKFLYELKMRKFDGKEASISLTHKDIKSINFIREEIFNSINRK